MVPDFYREREWLPRFLNICEKLVLKFYINADINDFQNEYLLMSTIYYKDKGT